MSSELSSSPPPAPTDPGSPSLEWLPETPLDALGPTIRETVNVNGQTFIISRPDKVDPLIDHPAIRAWFARDEYMPYWADLWPAARMLAKAILREKWASPADGTPLLALEIGCGLGLPGIAALACGLRVIFSDYDATALIFASNNARINGFDNFDVLQMDWRRPPDHLQVPVILGSDLIYEQRMADPLAAVIRKLLAPTGICLLASQDRPAIPTLLQAMQDLGLTFSSSLLRSGVPGQGRYKGTLYRVTHAASGPVRA
jgi:predicted nicotinamide N-methyase